MLDKTRETDDVQQPDAPEEDMSLLQMLSAKRAENAQARQEPSQEPSEEVEGGFIGRREDAPKRKDAEPQEPDLSKQIPVEEDKKEPSGPVEPDELEKLRAQLEAKQKLLMEQQQQEFLQRQLAQASQQQQQKPKAQEGLSDEELLKMYGYSIPSHIVEGLASEDASERSQAVGALLQSYGASVHKNVLEHVMTNVVPQIRAEVQQRFAAVEAGRDVARDFYSRYPQLDNPNLKPLVAQVAAQVEKEFPNVQYTPQVGDFIAQRVAAVLNAAQGFGAQPSATGQAQLQPRTPSGGAAPVRKKQAPRQPYMTASSGARVSGAPPQADENSPGFITRTLGAGWEE